MPVTRWHLVLHQDLVGLHLIYCHKVLTFLTRSLSFSSVSLSTSLTLAASPSISSSLTPRSGSTSDCHKVLTFLTSSLSFSSVSLSTSLTLAASPSLSSSLTPRSGRTSSRRLSQSFKISVAVDAMQE